MTIFNQLDPDPDLHSGCRYEFQIKETKTMQIKVRDQISDNGENVIEIRYTVIYYFFFKFEKKT